MSKTVKALVEEYIINSHELTHTQESVARKAFVSGYLEALKEQKRIYEHRLDLLEEKINSFKVKNNF